MNIQVLNQQSKFRIPKKRMIDYSQKLTQQIVVLFKKKKIFVDFSLDSLHLTINLVFVSKNQIKSLNSDFRDKKKETDILSFKSEDPDCFGELIFCPEVILSNAKKNKWPLIYEYNYMLTHGVLHLLGFDHQTLKDETEMFNLQDHLFNKSIKNQKFKVYQSKGLGI